MCDRKKITEEQMRNLPENRLGETVLMNHWVMISLKVSVT